MRPAMRDFNRFISVSRTLDLPDVPCGRLDPYQALSTGQQMFSCNGKATLTHQTDGNVVICDRAGALWHTRTHGKVTTEFVMQGDGTLVLYDTNRLARWSSGTYGRGNFMRLTDDCAMVVYDERGVQVFSTGTVCR